MPHLGCVIFGKMTPFWSCTVWSRLSGLAKFLFKCVRNNYNALLKKFLCPNVLYLSRYFTKSTKKGQILSIMPHPTLYIDYIVSASFVQKIKFLLLLQVAVIDNWSLRKIVKFSKKKKSKKCISLDMIILHKF